MENRGQWRPDVRFVSLFGNAAVRAERTGLTVLLAERGKALDGRGQLVRLSFEGCGQEVAVRGEGPTPGAFHFLVGSDPERWRAGVGAFAGVVYEGLYPGVDLHVRTSGSRVDWNARCASAASLATLVLRVEGVEPVENSGDGSVTLRGAWRSIRLGPPSLSIDSPDGTRATYTARFRRLDGTRVGVDVPAGALGGGTASVNWSTYLGGSHMDAITDVAIDAAGLVTVAGYTKSVDFPTTPEAFQPDYMFHNDGFVTRLDPSTQQLVFSTFLSGTSGGDQILRMELVGAHDVVVAGRTNSVDFPITANAFDKLTVGIDAFITRLGDDGSTLVWSTFLGGEDLPSETISGLAVADDGAVVVVGETGSAVFPTTPGAFDIDLNGPLGGLDGFVSKIDATGSRLVYSTYLGGADLDRIWDVMVDERGAAVAVGSTRSSLFPTTPGAVDQSHNGSWDAFVARLSPDGSSLEFSTFLGGPGLDASYGVALDPRGHIVVAGEALAPGFPTTPDAYDPIGNGFQPDVFITRLHGSGNAILYSTYLGGLHRETRPMAVVVDGAGAVTVAGVTASQDYPVTPGAFQELKASCCSGDDAFVTRLHPSGKSLLYSTFLGGTKKDAFAAEELGLATDALGNAVVAMWTFSDDYPTTPGSFDPTFNGTVNGSPDGAITHLTMLPTGAVKFGESTPGPSGPLASGVLSMPQVGNDGFGLTCTNAPRHTPGFLLFSGQGLDSPTMVAGVQLWIDPARILAIISPRADELGWAEIRVPIPEDAALAGLTFFAQFVWPDATLPGALVSSNALVVRVQQ